MDISQSDIFVEVGHDYNMVTLLLPLFFLSLGLTGLLLWGKHPIGAGLMHEDVVDRLIEACPIYRACIKK